jgi:hypothetical protein
LDLVSAIPLSFPRLRSIILSCIPRDGNTEIQAADLPELIAELQSKSVPRYVTPDSVRIFLEPVIRAGFAVREINLFLSALFKITIFQNFDERGISEHLLYKIIRAIFGWSSTLKIAQLFMEAILDQMRFDSVQTRCFASILILISQLEFVWDGVSVRDLVFATVVGRTERIVPLPLGARWLRERFGQSEGFREVLEAFEQQWGIHGR